MYIVLSLSEISSPEHRLNWWEIHDSQYAQSETICITLQMNVNNLMVPFFINPKCQIQTTDTFTFIVTIFQADKSNRSLNRNLKIYSQISREIQLKSGV